MNVIATFDDRNVEVDTCTFFEHFVYNYHIYQELFVQF